MAVEAARPVGLARVALAGLARLAGVALLARGCQRNQIPRVDTWAGRILSQTFGFFGFFGFFLSFFNYNCLFECSDFMVSLVFLCFVITICRYSIEM